MESYIKRSVLRTCLNAFGRALKEQGRNATIVNDIDIDFYHEVQPHFDKVRFDYVQNAFENPFAFVEGLLEANFELKQNDCIILFVDHRAAHFISTFTLNSIFRRNQQVVIVLFEPYFAKKFYVEQSKKYTLQRGRGFLDEDEKEVGFDFEHTFLFAADRLEASYTAVASGAYDNDMMHKARAAMMESTGSILVVSCPAQKEDDDIDAYRGAVECGLVRLYEKKGDVISVTYTPRFEPFSDFVKGSKFFSGIKERQAAQVEHMLSGWWEQHMPGHFPAPRYLQEAVGGVEFTKPGEITEKKSEAPGKQGKGTEISFTSEPEKMFDFEDRDRKNEDIAKRQKAGFEKRESERVAMPGLRDAEKGEEEFEHPLDTIKHVGEKAQGGIAAPGAKTSQDVQKKAGDGKDIMKGIFGLFVHGEEKQPNAAQDRRQKPIDEMAWTAEKWKKEREKTPTHGGLEEIEAGEDREVRTIGADETGPGSTESASAGQHPLDQVSHAEETEEQKEQRRKLAKEKLEAQLKRQEEQRRWPYHVVEDTPESSVSSMIEGYVEEEGQPPTLEDLNRRKGKKL
ncbi:hypothetical protein FJZ26_02540 [Candidatus Parvarchaeota archaeon]|nr:hypothetical protein [Candidatus Parvarchaeota archaeon]